MPGGGGDPFNTLGWRVFFGIIGPAAGGVIAFIAGRTKDGVAAGRRKRTVGAALAWETVRLSADLGPVPTTKLADLEELRRTHVAIHPWMQGLVVESAELHPLIPTHWILLEQLLVRIAARRDDVNDSMRMMDVAGLRARLQATNGEGDISPAVDKTLADIRSDHTAAINELDAIRKMLEKGTRPPLWRRLFRRRRKPPTIVITARPVRP